MKKEDTEFELFKDILLEKSDLTEKELEKKILETEKEMKKTLEGKKPVNKVGILHLIAVEEGITLGIQSGSSPKGSDLQIYVDARERIKEFHLFTWEKLKEKINELLLKIENFDSNVYQKLEERSCYPKLISIMDTMFPLDELPKPKNIKELENFELQLLEDVPVDLQIVFKKTYAAFLYNTSSTSTLETFFEYGKEFKKINAKLRHPDDSTNPFYDSASATRHGSRYDWTFHPKVAFEFMEYHRGVLDHLVATRNFETHHNDTNAGRWFLKANRKISDPLTKMEHPANYVLLSGLTINCVYEFIELLQIWVDSNVINTKSTGRQ